MSGPMEKAGRRLDVTDLIISMRMPDITPEFEALHNRISDAQVDGSLTKCAGPGAKR